MSNDPRSEVIRLRPDGLPAQVGTPDVYTREQGYRGGWREAVLALDVEPEAGAQATDTLQVVVDVLIGNVWVSAARFPDILGNGGAKKLLIAFSQQPDMTGALDVTAALGADAIRQVSAGRAIRVVATASTGSGNGFVWSLDAQLK